ncbi:MAG: ADP-ribosylation factor-like protein [Promethearchaeota archaeon]
MLNPESINISSIKLSIWGHPAVGKTTILRLLTKDSINKKYLPTQGMDVKVIKYKNLHLKIWDFGGQSAYLNNEYISNNLIGSDLILIVTDSTPRNVLKSRSLIDKANEIVEEDSKIIAIANKQDLQELDGRMTPDRVENVLQVKTYGLTAINPVERAKLIDILNQHLKNVLIRRRLKDLEL